MPSKEAAKRKGPEEHPKGSGIKIYTRVNASQGKVFGESFRVTIPARITGDGQLHRQFKTKPEALEFAEAQFRGWQQGGRGFFELSSEEHQDARAALRLLEGTGLTLREVAEFAKPRLRPEGGQMTLTAIIAEMVEEKSQRNERGEYRDRSFEEFKKRSSRFEETFGERPAYTVTGKELVRWVMELVDEKTEKPLAGRSRLNYFRIAAEIFNHAFQSRYIGENPLDHVSDAQRRQIRAKSDSTEEEPSILTPEEAERLLAEAQATNDTEGLLPAVVLGLFCGLRTEELKRLQWSDVRLDEESPFVTVSAAVAKKRSRRHVDIPSNALQWLSLCGEREGGIVEHNYVSHFQKKFRKVAMGAGFATMEKEKTSTPEGKETRKAKKVSAWKHNAMRHSFGSYHFALHGDSLATARLLGHKQDDEVLFSHYRALARKEDAERYFSITPKTSGAKLVKFAG